MTNLNKLMAEFLGTFFLVLFGCGAIIATVLFSETYPPIFVAPVFGLTIAVMVMTFGHISGAHFNPAVTIGALSINKIEKSDAIMYIIAQCFGAVCGALFLKLSLPDTLVLGVTNPSIDAVPAMAWEFILTFVLMTTILCVTAHENAPKYIYGLAIGGAIMIDAFVGGNLTGASMNPARSFGPALVAGDFQNLYIYIIAPVLGAVAAAFNFKYVLNK